MGSHFTVFMSQGRANMGTASPVLLVDNRLSTKAIHVEKIQVGVIANLTESVTFYVRGGLTFGSTFDNRTILVPCSKIAGTAASLEGTVISEWTGAGAMAGISGVAAGSSIIHQSGLMGLAQYHENVCGGLVIPAGGSLGIFGVGSTGNAIMAGLEGFHG